MAVRSTMLALVLVTACSSDSSGGTSGGCAVQYDCPTGETCGTIDGTTFACHVSGVGKLGESCNQAQTLPSPCGDNLLCLGVSGTGTCRQWCSSTDPCPVGSGSCTALRTSHGATVNVCL